MPSGPERPRPSRRFLEKDLGEEYLFLRPEGDRFHVLNGSAREIYLLCDGSRTVEEIAAEILARYRVDERTAARDVEEALRGLAEIGLVDRG